MIFGWFGVIMRWFYMILHDFSRFFMDFAWFWWEILEKSKNWPRRRFGWGRFGRGETQKFQKSPDPQKLTLDPSQIDFGEVWAPYVDFWPSEIPLFWQKRQNGISPQPPPKMASKILQNPPKSCKINEKSPKITQNQPKSLINHSKYPKKTFFYHLAWFVSDLGWFWTTFSWFYMILHDLSWFSGKSVWKSNKIAISRFGGGL